MRVLREGEVMGDMKAAIDAIPDGARVRFTRERVMYPLLRKTLYYADDDGTLISVEAVTPSDDEVCASLLPDERITFDCEGETHTHWTYLDGAHLCAGPFSIRWSNGVPADDITNIRRVQP